MEINEAEAQVILKLIEQAFLDGFDEDELVELYEKLGEFVNN
ncbi:hypothetical protein [Serratia sp. P2ACOL2]|nr:hypothetical protein [Serratia sp. P2ACOL2]